MMRSKIAWLAAAAIAAVVALAVVIARAWEAMGPSQISTAGWLAMAFGVVAALALGIGLMSAIFYSSRHGYDDAVARHGDDDALGRHDC